MNSRKQLKKEAKQWVREAKRDNLLFSQLFQKEKISIWQKIKNLVLCVKV